MGVDPVLSITAMPAEAPLTDAHLAQAGLDAFLRVTRPCILVGLDGRVAAVNQSARGLLGETEPTIDGSLEACEPACLTEIFDGTGVDLRRDLRIAASNSLIPLRWKAGDENYNVNATVLPRRVRGTPPLVMLTLSATSDLADQFSALTVRVHEANSEAAAARAQHRILLEQHTQLQQFAYAMAHDLKGPLRRISAMLGFLIEDGGSSLGGDAQGLIDKARTSAERLSGLVSALLDYGQTSSRDLTFEEIDLTNYVRTVVDEFSTDLSDTTVSISANLGTVDADRLLLGRILANLLENSLKYRSKERALHLQVSGELAADQLSATSLTLTDNGQGIDPDKAGTLFEPFKRNHTAKTPGYGLGLATCNTICELHGWEISAAGRPGEMASFTITFARD